MTAPTHAAFGFLVAALCGVPNLSAIASAFGALLPDIDHPQSSIGRLFFFISHPLNNHFGHRNLIHSFIIWSPLFIIGLMIRSDIVLWLALGAWSHVLIDCWNVSGTKAFIPFTSKPVVIFKRDWRIVTGSLQEIVICVCLFGCIAIANYSYSLGGPRKLVNLIANSPKIMAEEYARAGENICYVRGKFRWVDGRVDIVKEWLVIGTEAMQNLVFWNGTQIVREPQHGAFLTAKLREESTIWPCVIIDGFARVNLPSFWFDGKKWFYADQGTEVLGRIKSVNHTTPSIRPVSSIMFDFDTPGASALNFTKNGDVDTIPCKYIRNYDGDTITVTIPSWPKILGNEIAVRVAGIDTPELQGTTGATKAMALEAKELVADLCKKADTLIIRNIERGKYFRLVADVYADGNNIAETLLNANLAKHYDGGTKPKWN